MKNYCPAWGRNYVRVIGSLIHARARSDSSSHHMLIVYISEKRFILKMCENTRLSIAECVSGLVSCVVLYFFLVFFWKHRRAVCAAINIKQKRIF